MIGCISRPAMPAEPMDFDLFETCPQAAAQLERIAGRTLWTHGVRDADGRLSMPQLWTIAASGKLAHFGTRPDRVPNPGSIRLPMIEVPAEEAICGAWSHVYHVAVDGGVPPLWMPGAVVLPLAHGLIRTLQAGGDLRAAMVDAREEVRAALARAVDRLIALYDGQGG